MRRPESGLGQTKPLKLQRPFGRCITQGGDADAARKPPLNGSLYQSRRDECHRYRHVDVTNAALLARGNGFDAGSARDDLVEPGTSARDGFDQCRTSLRLHWPRARSCGRGWKQDLLEPLGRRLRPRDQQRGVFFDRGRWNRAFVCAFCTGVHQQSAKWLLRTSMRATMARMLGWSAELACAADVLLRAKYSLSAVVTTASISG